MARMIREENADVEHLDSLGGELAGRGYLTLVITDAPRPRLEVLPRDGHGLDGTVICARDGHGDLWFWWAWGDRIAPAGELGPAAGQVADQLRPAARAA